MKEIQSITNIKYIRDTDGIHAMIQMDIDGRTAQMIYGQKLLDSHGFVFLGDDFYDFHVILPANPSDSRPEPIKLEGYTNDTRVAEYVRAFRKAIDSRTFREGPIT